MFNNTEYSSKLKKTTGIKAFYYLSAIRNLWDAVGVSMGQTQRVVKPSHLGRSLVASSTNSPKEGCDDFQPREPI